MEQGSISPSYPASCVVVTYMFASIGMVIANKSAVGDLQAGTLLLGIQEIASIAIVLMLCACGVTSLHGPLFDVVRWIPVSLISGCTLWAGMEALKYASLSTLTVIRNASPIFVLVAEWIVFGLRPTCSVVISLIVILIGVSIYTWDDLHSAPNNVKGILFITLDALLACSDRLLQRYLLAHRPIQLSKGALVLIANAVSLIPAMILLAGPCADEWQKWTWTTKGLAWGVVTLPGGAAMGYLGVYMACAVSATAAMVVANVDKVFVLFYGVVVMGDRMNFLKGVGCTIALVGGAWHAWARIQLPNQKPNDVAAEQSHAQVELLHATDA